MEDNLNFDIDDLFKEAGIYEEKPQEPTEPEQPSNSNDADVKEQTIKETEDRIAKDSGYESYAAMQKAKEQQMVKDAGLDDEETNKLIDKLVEARLANDPRMKKIAEIEETEKAKFVSNQLDSINSLSGEKYTSIDQLPDDVRKLWEKTGDLKQAFLAVKGEELLTSKNNDKGSLAHMASSHIGHTSSKVRALTEEEKEIYRSVMPDITEEELSKKTRPVE